MKIDNKANIIIQIPTKLKREFASVVFSQGKTMSYVIRDLILKYIEKNME